MKKEVADLWIAALESGEYKQTQGALQLKYEYTNSGGKVRPQGHCCLGVLCEIAIKQGLSIPVDRMSHEVMVGYDGERGVLPKSVMTWAGMQSDTGDIKRHEKSEDTIILTDQNDSGKTFKEIAQIIRDNWEKL